MVSVERARRDFFQPRLVALSEAFRHRVTAAVVTLLVASTNNGNGFFYARL